jgi:hypothetical protein
MDTIPTDSFPSDPIPDGTLLFEEDEQAIEHVLSKVLHMNAPTTEKVKLWLTYNNVKSMSNLLDL